METVKEVLMRRDGMDETDADSLIEDFQTAFDALVEGECEAMAQVVGAEELLSDYFGLEPDYLMEFI